MIMRSATVAGFAFAALVAAAAFVSLPRILDRVALYSAAPESDIGQPPCAAPDHFQGGAQDPFSLERGSGDLCAREGSSGLVPGQSSGTSSGADAKADTRQSPPIAGPAGSGDGPTSEDVTGGGVSRAGNQLPAMPGLDYWPLTPGGVYDPWGRALSLLESTANKVADFDSLWSGETWASPLDPVEQGAYEIEVLMDSE